MTTLHGTDVTLVGNDPNYLETTRWGILQSDAVTAVSESLRRTTVEQLGIHNEIEVVPNFIDPARFERGPQPARGRAAGRSRGRSCWSTSRTSVRSSGCSTSSASSSACSRRCPAG